jgi:hypothetical protein
MNARPLPDTADLPSPADLFGGLPIQQIRCRVALPSGAKLPPFAGSAWRGAIGWELQRLVCPFHKKKRPLCKDCLMNAHCPYALLFEEENTMPGLSDAPRGYLVLPEESSDKKNIFLKITLFGPCTKFIPLIVMALRSGQKVGLGQGREKIPYQMRELSELLPGGKEMTISFLPEHSCAGLGPFPLKEWIASTEILPAELRIRLSTPVRLRKKDQYLDCMDWPFFFSSLVRRLEALNCLFYDGQPLGKDRWLALKKGFHFNGAVKDDLKWRDMARYSSRQRQMIPLGGMVGEAVFESPSRALIEWIQCAELVHVGKAVVMGLGKVELLEG